MEFIKLASLNISSASKEDMVQYINHKIETDSVPLNIFYANSNLIMTMGCMQEQLNSHPYLVLNDGIALDAAAYLITRRKFKDNLNGTDFTPYLLKNFRHGNRVFLLGGKEGVAAKAATKLSDITGVNIVGTANGYSDMQDSNALLGKIERANPDVVLVALGNPVQEKWIIDNHSLLNRVKLFIGVGALLDFLSGNVTRAPVWVRKVRLEWLFRLVGEPKRLFKRYTIDMVRFFYFCLRHK